MPTLHKTDILISQRDRVFLIDKEAIASLALSVIARFKAQDYEWSFLRR